MPVHNRHLNLHILLLWHTIKEQFTRIPYICKYGCMCMSVCLSGCTLWIRGYTCFIWQQKGCVCVSCLCVSVLIWYIPDNPVSCLEHKYLWNYSVNNFATATFPLQVCNIAQSLLLSYQLLTLGQQFFS